MGPPKDVPRNQPAEQLTSRLYSHREAESFPSLRREGVSKLGIVDNIVKEKVVGIMHLNFRM